MAQIARSARFLQKAEAALLAAIEVYNKPTFEYREETFAILALNAWELLLKAKLLAENRNRIRVLHRFEHRNLKNGKRSRRRYPVLNRSGAALSHSLWQVVGMLENQTPPTRLDPVVRSNLEGLTEIRDSAIHFVVASPQLAKQVLEIGTAAVRNFIELARMWFQHDLSGRHFFLMPIGFVDGPSSLSAVRLSKDESKLIAYITRLTSATPVNSGGPFNVAIEVNLSFKRSLSSGTARIGITDDPTVARLTLDEQDIRKIYKWTHEQLLKELKLRYTDFKVNDQFSKIKRSLADDPQFVRKRFLDPENPKSGRKDFYKPGIVAELDKHYTRKAQGSV